MQNKNIYLKYILKKCSKGLSLHRVKKINYTFKICGNQKFRLYPIHFEWKWNKALKNKIKSNSELVEYRKAGDLLSNSAGSWLTVNRCSAERVLAACLHMFLGFGLPCRDELLIAKLIMSIKRKKLNFDIIWTVIRSCLLSTPKKNFDHDTSWPLDARVLESHSNNFSNWVSAGDVLLFAHPAGTVV